MIKIRLSLTRGRIIRIHDECHFFFTLQKIHLYLYLEIKMITDYNRPVSEIVKLDYRTADVFKKWQLNFCCGGETALMPLCESKDMDFDLVVKELEEATRDFRVSNQVHFNEWKTDFLIDFIIHVHHDYIHQVLPALKSSLDAFALTHTHKFPELGSITELIEKLFGMVMTYNRHEDEIIFPYMKQMYSAYKRNEVYGNLFVRTLRKPLHIVEKERLEIDELLNELKRITRNFTPPLAVCSSYQVLISKLEELYENLIQQQFLERNVLFPKAKAIEQNLLQR
jgi:regulator of cell morphogenesis and NO signaling